METPIQVARGKVRLKGRDLLDDVTIYKAAKDASIPYKTLHSYVSDPEGVKRISAHVLFAILTAGRSVEEAMDLRIGDVFELIPNGDEAE